MSSAVLAPVTTYGDIPGWFFWVDRTLFDTLLGAQRDRGPGDLVELGTYLGKSAVIIGNHLRPQERFVALDLFGRTDLIDSGDTANVAEVQRSYLSLTRRAFEHNYLALHAELPAIVEGPSSVIMEHVAPASVRFLHVDASHLYEHVRVDAENAREMLQPGGLVVFDDWRSEHTPGVTAAVWEAVFSSGLIPVAVTPSKFYGVFSGPEPYHEAMHALCEADQRIRSEEQLIRGRPVLRLNLAKKPGPVAAPADGRSEERLVQQLTEQLSAVIRAELEQRSSELRADLIKVVADSSTITRVRRRLRSIIAAAGP